MDIDNLVYSFHEQASLQIARLNEEISREFDDKIEHDHRLFKHNQFEEVASSERQHLETQLYESLKALGNHIYERCAVSVIDKKNKNNYKYSKYGVILLKSKDKVTLSECAPRKCRLMLFVISKITNLIEEGRFMTNRELYYTSINLCRSKSVELNRVLDDMCCLLGCSRVHLHILCQSRGLVYGNLTFKLKNNEKYDCLSSKEAMKIPTPQSPMVDVKSDAKFILVIEKDSVLQKIINQESSTNFVETYKVILFTARGYPDINSRAFINILWKRLNIPILVLTDADPHGCEIACCYKFGCYKTAYEASFLALPHIRWLGLLPSDVAKHPIPQTSMIDLTQHDHKKLESLFKRPYLQERPNWIHQLALMREMGKKAELESIDILGDYLTRTYLPNKLRYASWL